jgi:hypothetical protein
MDPDRLAGYETAFIALDAAVEADAAGDVQEAKALRNQALAVMRQAIRHVPPTWLRSTAVGEQDWPTLPDDFSDR